MDTIMLVTFRAGAIVYFRIFSGCFGKTADASIDVVAQHISKAVPKHSIR